MVCRLRRLAEPTSRWFQMFSHRGPVPPNHGCLLCNLPIAAEVHPHNHANYSVRMRMDRTHTYIIYYSIYNIYIYMRVCYLHIIYLVQVVLYVYQLRQMFATSPGFQQMPTVFSSSLRRDASSLVVCVDIYDRPFSQRGSGVGFVPPSMRVGGSGDTDHHRPAMPMLSPYRIIYIYISVCIVFMCCIVSIFVIYIIPVIHVHIYILSILFPAILEM